MNLIITDYCNRACPYCFAKGKVDLGEEPKNRASKFISLENVKKYVDFQKRGGNPILKLLGGEPSTHPQLAEIIDYGIENDLEITMFTNGLWNENVCEYVQNSEYPKLRFVFNVNEPKRQKEKENEMQAKSLKTAGSRACLGFNIYRKDFDLTFTQDLINQYGLLREIRLGLACPIVGENNSFLQNEALKDTAKNLVQQLDVLEKDDILGSLDCGFPLCIFDEHDLGRLTISLKKGFESICNSIIDVDPDLRAWPCFPLSKILNVNLLDFDNPKALYEYYDKTLRPLKNIGSIDECFDCKFKRREQCNAGGYCRVIRSIEKSGDQRILDRLNQTSVKN